MRNSALTTLPRSGGLWLKRLRNVTFGLRPRNESGTALLEFALVLPLLTMLAFGAVDLGRAYRTYGQLKSAAREGAFYAATHPGYQTSQSYGFGSGSPGACPDPANIAFHAIGEGGHTDFVVTTTPTLAIDCTDAPVGLAPGSDITVKVTKPNFQFITPVFPAIFGNLDISARITVVVSG